MSQHAIKNLNTGQGQETRYLPSMKVHGTNVSEQ